MKDQFIRLRSDRTTHQLTQTVDNGPSAIWRMYSTSRSRFRVLSGTTSRSYETNLCSDPWSSSLWGKKINYFSFRPCLNLLHSVPTSHWTNAGDASQSRMESWRKETLRNSNIVISKERFWSCMHSVLRSVPLSEKRTRSLKQLLDNMMLRGNTLLCLEMWSAM